MHPDLGQIFTPKIIADFMVEQLSISCNGNVLDPCFGEGVFLDSLLEKKFTQVTGVELDTKLYKRYQSTNNAKNCKLINFDFLHLKSNVMFDGIIMNPPFIRHEKINDLESYSISKQKLRKNSLYQDLKSNSNLYMYFILKSISLLNEQGELIVIFPDTWIKNNRNQYFLDIINKNARITKKIFLNGSVFGKDTIVDVCILKIVKTLSNNHVSINEHYSYEDGKLNLINTKNRVELKSLNHSTLSSCSKIRRGITTGYNDFFIIKENSYDNLEQIICSSKDVVGYSTKDARTFSILSNLDDEDNRNFFKDRIVKYKNEIIESKKPKTIYNSIISKKEWYTLKTFDCRGIIFNYMIRSNIKFVLNDLYLIRDNFYIIKPRIDKYLLLALLNNYYSYYRLELKGKSYGGGLLKLQKYDLDNLQILKVEKITANDKLKLIELGKMLISKNSEELILVISKILSNYEEESAEMVYKLYIDSVRMRLGG